MATTKIKAIHYNLKDATDYSINPLKTQYEKTCFRASFNCRIDAAHIDMQRTKDRFNKQGGRIAYRIIQSFKPGEIDPETAHKIGVEFARRYLSSQYEVVIGTHLDRAHIHNDICFNSVSFVDGSKHRDKMGDYYSGIRAISDELCKEHNLSIVTPKGHGKAYAEAAAERAGNPTHRSMIQADIDEVLTHSYTFQSFVDGMKKKGYTLDIREHIKRPKLKPPWLDQYFRFYKLGQGYDLEDIKTRLEQQRNGAVPAPAPTPQEPPKAPKRYRAIGPIRGPRRKLRGFLALYYRYMYILGKVKRRTVKGPAAFVYRRDVIKLQQYSRQLVFLHQNGLENQSQVLDYWRQTVEQIGVLTEQRRPLYGERRNADAETAAELSAQITAITGRLRELRRDAGTCKRILETAPKIQAQMLRAQEIEVQIEARKQQDHKQKKKRELPKL